MKEKKIIAEKLQTWNNKIKLQRWSNKIKLQRWSLHVGLQTWLPAGDPEEEEAVVLQQGDVQLPHLVVSQRAVGQLHVDVPGGVRHHHRKLTQDGHVQVADVTADPLWSGGRHLTEWGVRGLGEGYEVWVRGTRSG